MCPSLVPGDGAASQGVENLPGNEALRQPKTRAGGNPPSPSPPLSPAGRIRGQSGDDDDPEGPVGLTVAASVQPMTGDLARGGLKG